MSLPPTYVEGFHDKEAVLKMPFTTWKHTNMEPSVIGFGGAALSGFYGEFEEKEGIETVQEALRKGVNYIDTAPYYGEGRSEALIGKALKGVPRQAYYLSTKCGRYSKKIEEMFDYSPAKIKSRFETSLQLLGVDYVDILILHDVEFGDLEKLLQESLPALKEIQMAGKARFLGISGYILQRLKEVICKSSVQISFVLNYNRDTLLDRSLGDYYKFFKDKGINVINASATASQLLTNVGPPDWHLADDNLKQLCKEAANYCKENGVELGKLAVYFTLNSEYTDTLLIGMNSKSVLNMNLDIVINGLTEEEERVLRYIRTNILNSKDNLAWPEDREFSRYNMKFISETIN